MGHCGCAYTAPDYRIPGPAGVTYGIEIYPSCHDCETPASVIVYRFDDANTADTLGGVPELPFAPYDRRRGGINAEGAIPVLEPLHLIESLQEVRDLDSGVYLDSGVSEAELREALPDAVRDTFDGMRL